MQRDLYRDTNSYYVHAYMYTYIPYVHTYIHTYIHTCTYIYMYTYIHTCILHTFMTRNGFGRWRDAREYGGLRARGVLPRQRHTKIGEFMLAITAATTPK